METNLSFLVIIIVASAAVRCIKAQNQTGLISLDCGLEPKDYIYTEQKTGIIYTSDANFTDVGESVGRKPEDRRPYEEKFWYLRRFPEGIRNCHNLKLRKGDKYLIEAGFLYDNYDNKNELPSFDLYLGPNRWGSVEFDFSFSRKSLEAIHILTSNLLQVCLVKTGNTVPFISYLNLRPLPNETYNTQTGSLMMYRRNYLSDSIDTLRFKEDILDRTWHPYYLSSWKEINTTLDVDRSGEYELPQIVARSAATPKNESLPLDIFWSDDGKGSAYYVYLHFAEVELLKANDSRVFSIKFYDESPSKPFSPPNFTATTIYTTVALRSDTGIYEVELQRTGESTHPPLLNAIEIYKVIELPELDTEQNDVDAIRNIILMYDLKKLNWQGDPCAPPGYMWEGLNCSYKSSEAHKIKSLNLSSNWLKGPIASSIANLSQLQTLDLSNNNLTGEVPEFLARMKSLTFIDLSSNQLNHRIPQALFDKAKDGSLTLKVGNEGDGDPCKDDLCHQNSTEKKIIIPIVASVATITVLIAAVALFIIFRRKYQKNRPTPQPILHQPATSINTKFYLSIDEEERRFSYYEVRKMTNNFEKILGRGGSGVVYKGLMDGSKLVAVKVLSGSSAQGYKQFKAEVELLMRVHHKNLVSLMGYCDEGGMLALIYEYMQNGDLNSYLSGKHGGRTLNWADRLRIAMEAAQGLEYLHNSLKPPIVHRDVKTTNILLNEKFQAKLADFGLSRSYSNDGESYLSTTVAGTPGYLDPEYWQTNRCTEKSDVYGFGIVLLEIMTNRPVIDGENYRIKEWVKHIAHRGDITAILDPRLNGDFDKDTAWKAVELAMLCTNTSSAARPTMPFVVMELKECLAAEMERIETPQRFEYLSHPLDVSIALVPNSSPGAR